VSGDAPADSPADTSSAPAPPAAGPEDPTPTENTGLRWWREILYVLAFYLLYSWIRNRFGSNSVGPEKAYEHARQIIDLEEAMGLYVEPTVQRWFVEPVAGGLRFTFAGAKPFLQFWNVFYGTFHFVVTAGALLWLYRRFPGDYRRWRNTLAFTTGLALVGFSLYPLMPPRLLSACTDFGQCIAGYGYVDSLRDVGGLWSFDSGTMQAVSNQYAAMPSLHFGWSLWSFCVLYPRVRHRWSKVLIALYPPATLFAIVVTANHYWIDAVGGALTLAVGYLLGSWLTNVTEHRRAARPARGTTPGPSSEPVSG
jgi:hypothetical protein